MTRRPGYSFVGLVVCSWVVLYAGMALAQPAAGAAAPMGAEAAAVGEVAAAVGEIAAAGEAAAGASPETAPAPAPAQGALMAAWRAPAGSLEVRVDQVRRAALEVGAWNFDPAARALIRGAGGGTPLERAQAAVRLAPDLPAAHVALARALWIDEGSPMAAVRAVVAGLRAAGHHPEASLWFAGSALYIASVALIGAGVLVIAIGFLACAGHAAHDVGHLLRAPVPPFAGFAALAALLLLPLIAGEGLVGVAVGLLAVAMLYATNGGRFALGLAAAALFAGIHPLPRLAADALAAFPSDPVAQAAYSTAHGLPSPVDLARLERATDDPLAQRALAIHARQTGNLGRADALYQGLLERDPLDVAVINNAANVRLELGHVRSALDLYERAMQLADSPVVLFNLSQAYGRSFQVDDLNRALAEAQRADGELVAHFTALQRTKAQNFVVDYPLSNVALWRRALARGHGEPLAAEFRARVAPGRVFASRDHAAAVFAVVVGAGWMIALRFRASRSCARCGGRRCPRCGHGSGAGELCMSCTRLFYEPEKTDRTLRVQRIDALRRREERMRRVAAVVSVLIPGAAGVMLKRPLCGLVSAVCFALAAAAVIWRAGAVPDPLVAGAAGPIAFLGAAALAGFVYVALVATAVAAARES